MYGDKYPDAHIPEPESWDWKLPVGQRVIAKFDQSVPMEGIISGERTFGAYPVQFEPCGCHWLCHLVSAYGSVGGFTEQEYRVAREKASSLDHAKVVERERVEKYPGASFSSYRYYHSKI